MRISSSNFKKENYFIKKTGQQMGDIKTIIKTLFILLLMASSFFFQPTLADTHQAQITNVGANLSDNNRIIRVAISDTGFKSFVYNDINIVATGKFSLYEKNTNKKIADFFPQDVVKIKLVSGKFEVNLNNKTILKEISSPIVIDSPTGFLGVENLKRNRKQALYHGKFELTAKNDTQFYLINFVNLEDYLKGVVPNEMPVRFGLEALKAQAIAARNYVLMPRTRAFKEFDVDDSVASQVYFGASTECELSNKAVLETNGLVALYNWNLILAQYSSTAGGYTENYENVFSDPKTKHFPSKEKPYLKGKPDIMSVPPLEREEEAKLFYMSYPDSYDIKSPYYRWQKEWSAEELQEILAKNLINQSKTGFVYPALKNEDILGKIKELKVNKRGVSGKIMELEIVTENGNYKIEKELVIRRLLTKNGVSLPSANVVFENLYDTEHNLNKIVAYGGGFGHGVGMSQYGAGFMASSLHKTFDKILKRYYSGISITTQPIILSSNIEQSTVTQSFYCESKKVNLIVDNKYQIKEFNANINNKKVSFELTNSFLPFNRISKIDISSYLIHGKNTITFYFPQNENNKAIRLYIELYEKDKSEYNF